MKAKIVVTFEMEMDESETKLAEFEFQPSGDGRNSTLCVGPADVRLPNGTAIQISSSWAPKSNMISLLILDGEEIIGHAGSCWHLGDPYLGVRLHEVGFVHIYCQRER